MSDQVFSWPALYFALQILPPVLPWLTVTCCRGDTHSILLSRLLYVWFIINRYPVELMQYPKKYRTWHQTLVLINLRWNVVSHICILIIFHFCHLFGLIAENHCWTFVLSHTTENPDPVVSLTIPVYHNHECAEGYLQSYASSDYFWINKIPKSD